MVGINGKTTVLALLDFMFNPHSNFDIPQDFGAFHVEFMFDDQKHCLTITPENIETQLIAIWDIIKDTRIEYKPVNTGLLAPISETEYFNKPQHQRWYFETYYNVDITQTIFPMSSSGWINYFYTMDVKPESQIVLLDLPFLSTHVLVLRCLTRQLGKLFPGKQIIYSTHWPEACIDNSTYDVDNMSIPFGDNDTIEYFIFKDNLSED